LGREHGDEGEGGHKNAFALPCAAETDLPLLAVVVVARRDWPFLAKMVGFGSVGLRCSEIAAELGRTLKLV
jgi:hypothetical protein